MPGRASVRRTALSQAGKRRQAKRGAALGRNAGQGVGGSSVVDERLISPADALDHPDLNMLTRALGKGPEVEADVNAGDLLLPGDTLLLCTDGLWGHLSAEVLLHELTRLRSVSETAEALVECALASGSDDNITVQVLRLEQSAADRAVNPTPTEAEPAESVPADARRTTLVPSAVPANGWQNRLRAAWRSVLALLVICVALLAGATFLVVRAVRRPHPVPCLPGVRPEICRAQDTGTAPRRPLPSSLPSNSTHAPAHAGEAR